MGLLFTGGQLYMAKGSQGGKQTQKKAEIPNEKSGPAFWESHRAVEQYAELTVNTPPANLVADAWIANKIATLGYGLNSEYDPPLILFDFGSGDGHITDTYTKLFLNQPSNPGIVAVGLDVSKAQIAHARKHYEAHNDNLFFAQIEPIGSVRPHLPEVVADRYADIIIARFLVNAEMNLEEINATIGQMREVAKKGARVFFIFRDPNSYRNPGEYDDYSQIIPDNIPPQQLKNGDQVVSIIKNQKTQMAIPNIFVEPGFILDCLDANDFVDCRYTPIRLGQGGDFDTISALARRQYGARALTMPEWQKDTNLLCVVEGTMGEKITYH